MSFLMILRIAVKALNRNKMRTALTMLGMIIGVAAVITMVALGTGAQTSIEAQIQSAGTNMIIVSAGNFSQGGVRQGQGNAVHPGARGCGGHIPAAGRAVHRGRLEHARTDRLGQSELEHPGPGHRRGLPVDPGVADQQRRLLHAAGCRDRVEGRRARQRRARSAVRDRRRPDWTGDPHHQTAVHGGRRHVQQGSVGHGPGPGRRDLHPVHHGPEEAARHHQHPERDGVGGVGRRCDESRRQHRHGAAGAPQDSGRRSGRLHGPHHGRDGQRQEGSDADDDGAARRASPASRCWSAASAS